jgi:hypothetical protein
MIGAVTSIAILLAIATLHAYWASGGTFGKGAAIPERNGQPILRPSPIITYLVAGCFALAALVIAMRAGLVPSAAFGPLPHLATWALAAVFAVRAVGDFRYVGFFKRVRGTQFSRLDTALYSPLCCLLALLIADAARM